MRTLLSCAIPAVLIGAHLQAQSSSGAAIDSKFDTAQARVYIAALRPHTPIPSRNGHATNRMLIYLDSGKMTRQEGGGALQTLDIHRGDVRWRPASGAYTAENIGDGPLRVLEIDLKGPGGPLPATKLDPAVVDSRHYKVVFENQQVRVLRIHYEAHEKGELHQHILNRVVLYLNDQRGIKADEVRMAGAGTHAEENAGDQAADRLAVELKEPARRTRR